MALLLKISRYWLWTQVHRAFFARKLRSKTRVTQAVHYFRLELVRQASITVQLYDLLLELNRNVQWLICFHLRVLLLHLPFLLKGELIHFHGLCQRVRAGNSHHLDVLHVHWGLHVHQWSCSHRKVELSLVVLKLLILRKVRLLLIIHLILNFEYD